MTQVEVTASANIALVKYWGKADAALNIPAVGSLSLTLAGLKTKTTLSRPGQGRYRLDGAPMLAAESARMQTLAADLGLDPSGIDFESSNDFPTAAGLASSASGGAAAVLAMQAVLPQPLPTDTLLAATLKVSGSAPRSLVGGFARLDPVGERIALRELPIPAAWDLRVLIVTTASGRKKHASRDAMEQSKTSPYYQAWVDTHKHDLDVAEAAIAGADFAALCAVMEQSTMKMHALPLTSNPPLVYWNGVTLDVLHALMDIRERSGRPAGFTMDAGPHVKVFTMAEHAAAWQADLAAVPGVGGVLVTACGEAPVVRQNGDIVPWSL